MSNRASSPADVTPVDASAVPPLREELAAAKTQITGIHDLAELIRGQQASVFDEINKVTAAIGPLADKVNALPTDIARLVGAETEKARLKNEREWKKAIETSEAHAARRLVVAINAAGLIAKRDAAREKLLTDARIEKVEHDVAELGLKTGVELHRAETAIQKLARPVGYSAGGAGICLAVEYLGPLFKPLFADIFAAFF